MPYIEQIILELKPKRISGIQKTLKSQRIPRSHINNTKPMKIYSRYGANEHKTNLSHAEDYFQLRSRLKNLIAADYFTLLEEAAGLYEAKFGRWFEDDMRRVNHE
jgi:Tfp pilus assembly major pilin PilA